jgi:hypothetical protein
MPILRHRLATLLMPLALCLGLVAAGFGHRGFTTLPDRALLNLAALQGVPGDSLCGATEHQDKAEALGCEACRLVASIVLPERGGVIRRDAVIRQVGWPKLRPCDPPLISADRTDPARAPPLA